MAKDEKSKDLVTTQAGGALSAINPAEITEDDERGYEQERPLTVYCRIRQKDKKSDDGKKTVQPAGGFTFQDPVAGETPDEDVIEGVIVASFKGRVYFQSPDSPSPDCKSIDGLKGSRQQEGDKFGYCDRCILGAFIGDDRPECREIRNLCVVREKEPRAFVLAIGPSALKPWRIYDQKIFQETRKKKSDAKNPLHHFFVVSIGVEFKEMPAPHFVPVFKFTDILTEKQRAEIRELRAGLFETFKAAIQAQDHRAEDYVGPKQNGDEEVPF